MIAIAVFAFAVFHPGRAFNHAFGNLRSSTAEDANVQKAESVEMRPASVETPFLSRRQPSMGAWLQVRFQEFG